MRSKILIGVLGVAVAFLLATNPLVAQAAGFISSADIINNTVKSQDIKNNHVKSKDIRDNTIKSRDVKDGTLTHPDLTTGSIGIARGYAWNDVLAPVGTVTLTKGYTYNSSGGNVTVSSPGTGVYNVTFTGLSWDPGNVQVSGYGATATWCNVGSWGSPTVTVRCYDAAGAPANSLFTVAVIE